MESAWKVLGKSFLWQALAVACIIYMIFTIHVQYIGKDCRCPGVWCASIDSRFLGYLGIRCTCTALQFAFASVGLTAATLPYHLLYRVAFYH